MWHEAPVRGGHVHGVSVPAHPCHRACCQGSVSTDCAGDGVTQVGSGRVGRVESHDFTLSAPAHSLVQYGIGSRRSVPEDRGCPRGGGHGCLDHGWCER